MLTAFQDYKIKKEDIIKLGRVKYKIKDFRTDSVQAKTDIEVIKFPNFLD
jgi:hypothetical protein